MNFTPISNYNNLLKNNMSLDVNPNMDFEKVLSQHTEALQKPYQVQGGVELNNFDDVLAKSSVQSTDNDSPTGNLIKTFQNSIGGGLGSVNQSIKAADQAQEAFARGENVSVHDVMISAEKAQLNLAMAMQLRNKVLSAYSEINNVRV